MCDALLTTKDNVLTVEAFIENMKVELLVDTGASANYVSKAFLDTLSSAGLNLHVCTVDRPIQVTVANNVKVSITHKVDLSIQIDGIQFKTDFIIMDSLLFDLILGFTFCKTNKLLLDMNNNTIHFCNEEILVLSVDKNRIVIPPFSERIWIQVVTGYLMGRTQSIKS